MRRAFLAGVAAASLGCGAVHLPHNAPGNIDVATPPLDLTRVAVERPADPGEYVLAWTTGALVGGGLSTSSAGTAGVVSGSAETSLHLGVNRTSHRYDVSELWPLVNGRFGEYPMTGWAGGLNLGWTLGTAARPASSAGYAEAQLTYAGTLGMAAGWAWDPARTAHGPQITVNLGPLYLRSTTMLAAGTSIEAGLVLKIPAVWVWSR
jgi:hypothetical protein